MKHSVGWEIQRVPSVDSLSVHIVKIGKEGADAIPRISYLLRATGEDLQGIRPGPCSESCLPTLVLKVGDPDHAGNGQLRGADGRRSYLGSGREILIDAISLMVLNLFPSSFALQLPKMEKSC